MNTDFITQQVKQKCKKLKLKVRLYSRDDTIFCINCSQLDLKLVTKIAKSIDSNVQVELKTFDDSITDDEVDKYLLKEQKQFIRLEFLQSYLANGGKLKK